MSVTVTIDGRSVEVPVGTSVLEAARLAGVDIPTLCHHPDLPANGACRLCVVEVQGQRGLQASCSFPVTEPVEVSTRTPQIRRARQDLVDLLLAEHDGDCLTCTRNGHCELQDLAARYGSSTPRFGRLTTPHPPLDDVGPSVVRDLSKCVHCQRCVQTCADLQGIGALNVLGRGAASVVSSYSGLALVETDCVSCGQCINRCPTDALAAKDDTAPVRAALDDPRKHVVIQLAPAPRAAIGEEFGLEPGTAVTFRLVTALRELGFDAVFDTSFAADLTIIEEGTELLQRLYENIVLGDTTRPLPQLTSCSPGWVSFAEHVHQQHLAHLSSAKSPQQMFGALLKTWYARRADVAPADVVSVSLMPCTAKKFEAGRPEMTDSGHRDVDHVLTSRELAQMLKEVGLDLPGLDESDFDDPFGSATGSGVIFGATGGVMEAALRTVIELVTGRPVEDLFDHADIVPVRGFDETRYVEVTLPQDLAAVPELLAPALPVADFSWLAGVTLKLAVVHGTANIAKVMADVEAGGHFSQCHFIELMGCPGGCLGGGGQPIPTSTAIRQARARAIYAEDSRYGETGRARKSHENPAVLRLYAEELVEGPCGTASHHLLHTAYVPGGVRPATGEASPAVGGRRGAAATVTNSGRRS